MATIQDIADKAGVSIGTVSRVLNAKPDVSARTRKRILDVMEELHYRPSGVARGLALQKSRVIGYLVHDIMNPNFPELARGIVDQARLNGYSVMFFDTRRDMDMEREAAHILENEHVAGVVGTVSKDDHDELERLYDQGVPVVRIYRSDSGLSMPLVALDNVHAGAAATTHLLDLGHRRIAFIGRHTLPVADQERLTGYRSALASHGITPCEELVVTTDLTREGGKEAMERLLALPEPPTAVFASKDVTAIGTYDAIVESGRTIPDDISVVGHDDIEAASLVRPQLTTLTTYRHRLGEAAVDLLFQQINKVDTPEVERVFVAELVVRESTGPAQRRRD